MKINLTEKTRNTILEKLAEESFKINLKIKKIKIKIIDLESFNLIDQHEYESKFLSNTNYDKYYMAFKIQKLKLIIELELFILKFLNNQINQKINLLRIIRGEIKNKIKNIFKIKDIELIGNIIHNI